MKQLTVAIDGPAAAGKSTVARAVASALNYTYIDTGAMYRAVAWKMIQEGVPLEDSDGATRITGDLTIEFAPGEGGTQRVFADGQEITDAVRTPEVTQLSSPVSAIGGVRKLLVAQQQKMGDAGGVVMEGRDIGTVVFPSAEVKVFLTASDEERARRRFEERKSRDTSLSFEEVLSQLRERDARDSSRDESPLRPAEDSISIDSTAIHFNDVVAQIVAICRERGA